MLHTYIADTVWKFHQDRIKIEVTILKNVNQEFWSRSYCVVFYCPCFCFIIWLVGSARIEQFLTWQVWKMYTGPVSSIHNSFECWPVCIDVDPFFWVAVNGFLVSVHEVNRVGVLLSDVFSTFCFDCRVFYNDVWRMFFVKNGEGFSIRRKMLLIF